MLRAPRSTLSKPALAAALLLAGPGAGQEPPAGAIEETAPPPREAPIPTALLQREEVRFVTLDLIAERKTRGRWRRVRDLTEERVKVFVGGEEMTFDVFENWCPAPEPGAVQPAAPATAGEPDGEAPTRRFVLYFDLQHLKTPGHHASFDAARRWATQAFRPDDEVMILTGSLGLRIIRQMRPASEGLMEDLALAEAEFREATRWADGEGDDMSGRVREILDMLQFQRGGQPVQAEGLRASFVAQEYVYTRNSLQNLRDLMALFESIEGTKNLIVFQETIRMYPGSEYPQVEIGTPGGGLASPARAETVEPFVVALARAANERNVRIYPVDAGGMEGEENEALHLLADETGGRFYTRSNDLGPAIDLVAEDDACFYRIGFRVRPRFSGSVSRIQVQIDGPRLDHRYRKRHRQTLADPTREQRDIDRIRAALLDPAAADAFPVWVGAVPLLQHPDGARVRLQVSAAFEDLLMIRAGEGDRPASQVLVQVGGAVVPLREAQGPAAAGRRSVLYEAATDRPPWQFARQALLELPHGRQAGPGAGRFLALAREIEVPPGRYRFIAVVQDRLAGVLAAATSDFQVGGDAPVVGEVRLAVEDPRMYFLVARPDEERDRPVGRRKDGPGMMPAVLPEAAFVRTTPSLRSEPAGSVIYGLCDPAAPEATAFEGWELQRALSCNGEAVAQTEPPTSLHPAGVARTCATVIDPLPVGALQPGLCRYSITAALPDGSSETRSLEFHVLGGP